MTNDAEILEVRVRENVEKRRLNQKGRYRLAKELGFTPDEAAILMNWSEVRIRSLAESKAKGF